MKLVLRNYWRSSASHRVRTALGLKGLAFEYVPVSLLGGDQLSEAYRAKNPMAQVPTLELTEDDGAQLRLTQSIAIIEYLEERWPDPPLLPRELFLRARARLLAELCNSGMQPHQNLATLRKLKALGVETGPWVQGFLGDGLAAFAHFAAETAGAFCVGDAPTIADVCLVPQLASARRFGVPLERFPQLLEIEARCLSLPAFADAMPDRQPDAQQAS